MGFGLEIIGLAAAGTFAVSLGIAARLCGRFNPKPVASPNLAKTALHAAVARERAATKRNVIPEKIALMVVEYLRNEGLNAYPLIPEDLDDEINRWCDVSGVERPSTQHVRELIAMLPGVSRDRIRPNTNHPKNRSVRNRMIARGRTIGEKATVYTISDGPVVRPDIAPDTPPDMPMARPNPVRTVSNSGRTDGRSGRTREPKVRPDIHQDWSDIQRREAA
mgnify:CR=1 FL=1